jgi:predicted metal-binding protein
MAEDQRACLHICVTCRGSVDDDAVLADPVPGLRLHDGVSALLRDAGDTAIGLKPVVCLANCERGCSAAISAPGKWAYMVGGLGPEHAADLVAYARAYAASDKGVVLRSGRPDSLRYAILGRFPASVSDLAWTPAVSPTPPTKEAAE